MSAPHPILSLAPRRDDDTHAEDYSVDVSGVELAVVMFCGLVVTFDKDGNAIPTGAFYAPNWRHKATCKACRGDA